MELTILLSKVFGVYLIIGGIACLVRRKYFMATMHTLVEAHVLRWVIAAAELTAGLFLIFTHNDWSTLETGLVSLFGWILALEGVMYMFISDRMLNKFLKAVNRKAVYLWGGILSLIVGVYLVNFGFNLGLF